MIDMHVLGNWPNEQFICSAMDSELAAARGVHATAISPLVDLALPNPTGRRVAAIFFLDAI
jgi:hypothetical protein